MLILENLRLATSGEMGELLQWDSAWIVVDPQAGTIMGFGPGSRLPRDHELNSHIHEQRDLGGKLVTPGLIDCHTHLIYAGNRSGEFWQRNAGASYEEIARAGGGIHSTVFQTTQASDAELEELLMLRAQAALKQGVTTLEVKSGYGLLPKQEVRLLECIAHVQQTFSGTLVPTCLGAHAIPPQYKESRAAFLSMIRSELIPEVARRKLASSFDVFCESIAFDLRETESLLETAAQFGLPGRLHAEQLSSLGSPLLASRFKILSCDHLEFLSEEGVQAMELGGSVAVLLPGAFLYLRETQRPPISSLRSAGVPMAIATDHNPGSSPIDSLLLAATLAAVQFELQLDEVFAGVTCHAAQALNLGERKGRIQVGFDADLCVWDVPDVQTLLSRMGASPCLGTFISGVWS